MSGLLAQFRVWILASGALGLLGCSTGYYSLPLEERTANSRRMLEEAFAESATVSSRTTSGAIYVERNLRFEEHRYCAELIAGWLNMFKEPRWAHHDREERIRPICTSYDGIESVRAKDMRDCEGAECEWVTGR